MRGYTINWKFRVPSFPRTLKKQRCWRVRSDNWTISSDFPEPTSHPLAALVAGKKFLCTECGKCCTGSGEVWVNEAEVQALSHHLNLPRERFLGIYAKAYRRRPGWYMLKRSLRSDHCIFLDPSSNKCQVYGARPLQCATYPWWPELMDPGTWLLERDQLCEGIEPADALDVDVPHATAMLDAAAERFADFHVAGRRRKDDLSGSDQQEKR